MQVPGEYQMPKRFLKPLASQLLNTYANAYGKSKEKSKQYLLLARKMDDINFYWNPKTFVTQSASADGERITQV